MWKLVCALALGACTSPTPAAPVEPAQLPRPAISADDPPRPTLRLPHHFAPISYAARLVIDPTQPTFTGHIEIAGELAKPAKVIWLHGKGLTIHGATATRDGVTVPVIAKLADDLVELRATHPFDAGRWVIAIDYDGVIDQTGFAGAYRQKYGDDLYVSTQFEATAARLVFPCLDEPGFKVPWQLTLDIPTSSLAVSNTPSLRTEPLDQTHVRVQFAKTRPLPSYLVAFAVGPWDIVDAGKGKSGVPLRIVVPRGQGGHAVYAAQVLPKIVTYLEGWFGIPFPYPKLDIVAVPSLRGGAMENAGMIAYDSRNILNDPEHPTFSARYNVLDTLGHETSHQWFGDLVTAAWWDDIWLNESFATWMQDKIVGAIEPGWHVEQLGVTRRNWAFASDSIASARKIRQPIENEGDIHNAFDGITYPKGASVLRMFEHYVGPMDLQTAIHDYLVAHADGSATAADLLAAIEATTKQKIGVAMSSFLDQPGVPMLDTELVCPKDKQPFVRVAQHRYLPAGAAAAPDGTWKMAVCIAWDAGKGARSQTCQIVDGASDDIALSTTVCPAWSFPDAGAFGYYRLAMTEADARRLRDIAWPHLTEAEQRSTFEAVRAYALDGKLSLATLSSFVPKLLAIGDRFSVGDALGDVTNGIYGPTGSSGGLPFGLVTALPRPLLAAAQARVRTNIGPLIAKLGLRGKPGDDIDIEARRGEVVGSAVWARDGRFDGEAVALAKSWRTLAPGQRRLVLWIAANASPEITKQLHADVFSEGDPQVRQELLAALGSIRDRARLREQLDMLLDTRLGAEDAVAMIFGFVDDDGRAETAAWLRDHMAALRTKFPSGDNDDFPIVLNLMYPFTSACDAEHRDDIASYVTQQFSTVPSGARPVAQAIELMDQCISRRKRLEPSVKDWLKQ